MIYEIILYPLFILAILVSFFAQIKVSTTFNRYSRIPCAGGKTAAEVAQMILSSHGLFDVRIERVGGNLTDHYDPREKVLRLSDAVYSSCSAAAVGVAAHEAGHALQHAENYFPVKLRSALVPVTNFASRISWFVIFVGLLIEMLALASGIGYYIILFGIGLFAITAVFQLVTLPCEFNASSRALNNLESSGWFSNDEVKASKKVLSAAAMTYVAALFVTVVQVLRLLAMFSRRRK